MTTRSLIEKATALAARTYKLEKPHVVDRSDAIHPATGKPIHRFRIVSAANANGPAFMLVLDDRGEALADAPSLLSLFERTVLTPTGLPTGTGLAAAPITVQPDTNVLTLNPGQTLDETITVTVPKSAGPAKVDVYFLADTTASMGSILNAVQTGANNVLLALNGLGADMVFGVGNYKDFLSGDPFAFQHQVSPTNVVATVTAAINSWSPTGGGDTPEAALFALDSLAVPPGGTVGWRAGSKRLIVWFGDAPSHDPICPAASGAAVAVTEASATAKLVAEGIAVLAISTATPGLDDDPTLSGGGYAAACGAPGGLAGQGTRIATQTGGQFVTGINAGNIVNTIISLVKGAVGGIQNLKLVPSSTIAPVVTSITPATGYGPLAADQEHVLKFEVRFTGLPCKAEAQVITGTLDVVADGSVVAAKRVQITIPPCPGIVYAAKFVCGVQPACECSCGPVVPGHYATEINIHNYSLKEVTIRKRFVPLVLAGAPVGREPRVAAPRAEDKIVLPRQTATFDDCCRIVALLLGGTPPSPMPLLIGYLEITASAEVAVTAVYTASGLKAGGVSIEVVQVTGRRL